jgi:hypothetical protein
MASGRPRHAWSERDNPHRQSNEDSDADRDEGDGELAHYVSRLTPLKLPARLFTAMCRLLFQRQCPIRIFCSEPGTVTDPRRFLYVSCRPEGRMYPFQKGPVLAGPFYFDASRSAFYHPQSASRPGKEIVLGDEDRDRDDHRQKLGALPLAPFSRSFLEVSAIRADCHTLCNILSAEVAMHGHQLKEARTPPGGNGVLFGKRDGGSQRFVD